MVVEEERSMVLEEDGSGTRVLPLAPPEWNICAGGEWKRSASKLDSQCWQGVRVERTYIYEHCFHSHERWGAGVETQKNVRGVFGGWGRVPFNEPYAPSLSTIYDGA